MLTVAVPGGLLHFPRPLTPEQAAEIADRFCRNAADVLDTSGPFAPVIRMQLRHDQHELVVLMAQAGALRDEIDHVKARLADLHAHRAEVVTGMAQLSTDAQAERLIRTIDELGEREREVRAELVDAYTRVTGRPVPGNSEAHRLLDAARAAERAARASLRHAYAQPVHLHYRRRRGTLFTTIAVLLLTAGLVVGAMLGDLGVLWWLQLVLLVAVLGATALTARRSAGDIEAARVAVSDVQTHYNHALDDLVAAEAAVIAVGSSPADP